MKPRGYTIRLQQSNLSQSLSKNLRRSLRVMKPSLFTSNLPRRGSSCNSRHVQGNRLPVRTSNPHVIWWFSPTLCTVAQLLVQGGFDVCGNPSLTLLPLLPRQSERKRPNSVTLSLQVQHAVHGIAAAFKKIPPRSQDLRHAPEFNTDATVLQDSNG